MQEHIAGKMYGLIIENFLGYLRSHYHPKRYEEIRTLARLPVSNIEIDKVYPETIIPKIGKKASQVLQISEEEIYEGVGVYFVTITKTLGLRKTVLSIAREFREFIANLDNAHDYFKLQFVKMRAPSFFVDQEHETGLILHYRSKRRGYCYYVMGQMKEIAKVIFKKDLIMTVLKQEIIFDTVVVTYKMEFDNSAYVEYQRTLALRQESSLPIRANILFDIFPFAILFTEDLTIILLGTTLRLIMPSVIGQKLNESFALIRPLVEFNSDQILQRTNNVWVLQALIGSQIRLKKSRNVRLTTGRHKETLSSLSEDEYDQYDEDRLQIKGVMMYMSMWKKILFIGCPIISDLTNLVANGLFINDLSMHDFSRDIMITTCQMEMEERMTKQLLENNDIMLEENKSKYVDIKDSNDKTWTAWMPQQILIQDKPENHVQVLDFGAVVLAKIDRMKTFSYKSDPIELIDLLDDVLRVFDHLTETIGVFKVETQADYLAVADYTAGLNERTQLQKVANLALDLDHASNVAFREPVVRGRVLRFKIVVLGGPMIVGVIGRTLPKFGIFGSCTKILETLANTCPAGKIITLEETKRYLPPTFRFSSVPEDNPHQCLYIDGKLDHSFISIVPVLHAYTAFKANKVNRLRTLSRSPLGMKPNVENKPNEVEIVKPEPCLCSKSSVCNVQ